MSRGSARSRRLRHRPGRTVPATITAVILLALGALAAVVAISRLVTGSWLPQVASPASAIAASTWGSGAVIAGAAVAMILGAVLMIAGLKPGGFTAAPLRYAGPGRATQDTDFVISTRAIARLAVARAEQVDGVDTVSASASTRRVHLQVTTSSAHVEQVGALITQGVTERLTAAGVEPTPRVVTSVRTKDI